MDEENDDIAFTDPRTFKRGAVVHDPSCSGPNHADFSANGRYFLVSCEFSGSLLKISTTTHRVVGRLDLGPGSKPQDVRLVPGRPRLLRRRHGPRPAAAHRLAAPAGRRGHSTCRRCRTASTPAGTAGASTSPTGWPAR